MGDNGRWFRRLPGGDGGFGRDWPRLVPVLDKTRLVSHFQKLQRLSNDVQLADIIPGHSQRLSEGVFNSQRSRDADLLNPIRHHGDQHG